MTQPNLIARMQRAIVRHTLTPLISDVVRQAEIGVEQLVAMVVAGNTTMLHLLVAVDPSSLGTAPFTPTFLEHRIVEASELSLGVDPPAMHTTVVGDSDGNVDSTCSPRATEERTRSRQLNRQVPAMTVHLLPGAAAYVGADITAGVLASGMAYRDDTCLLVDLGTNGEIVLRHQGRCIGCATAAGPAFEGAGLTHGVRAVEGAISHVWLDRAKARPVLEVVGRGRPIGLCGTAYIDFIARARSLGWISPAARFVDDEHPWLVHHQRHGRACVVADARDDGHILITEADMASLLQAKAAIAAGVVCLLREAQLEPIDVKTVYLAGGFGFHMHVDSLLGCGMLPGFHSSQVETVGNTALAGAYLTLLDSGALREIRRIGSEMKVIELNLAPDFEMIYVDQLMLP